MHLFSPDRPEVSPNQKALLIDGSAIPHFIVRHLSTGQVLVSVMLNNYDLHGGYSYRTTIFDPWDLSEFLVAFLDDPEEMLLRYFGWKPQVRSKVQPKPTVKAEPTNLPNINDLI